MYADIIFLEGGDISRDIPLPMATKGGKLQLQQLEVGYGYMILALYICITFVQRNDEFLWRIDRICQYDEGKGTSRVLRDAVRPPDKYM